MDEDSIPNGLAGLLADVGWARRLAAALVGEHDGEDLVQRVLTGAVSRGSAAAPGPQEVGRIRGYWRRALRFEAANLRRGQARRAAREQAASVPVDGVPDPAEVAEQLDQRRRLAEHLLALPEDLRYLLVLRYEKDLDSSEIGRRLNLSPSTVRTSLARARRGLRQRLEQDDPDWQKSLSLLAAGAARTLPRGAGFASVSLAIMNAKVWTALGVLGLLALTGWGLLKLDAQDAMAEPGRTSVGPEGPATEELAAEVRAPLPGAEQRVAVATEALPVDGEVSSAKPEVQPAAYPAEFRLLARLLDETGAPLAGGKLVLTYGVGQELLADSTGSIDAVVEAASVLRVPSVYKDRDLGWEIVAPGERYVWGVRRVGAESVVQLGDLQVQVYAAYSGRVVDSSGAGVGSVTVTVTHDVPADPFAPSVRWSGGQTDKDGYYSHRLSDIRGPVSIRVSSRGWTSAPLIAEPVLGENLVLADLLAERTPKRVQPRILLVDDAGDPIPEGEVLFDFSGRVRREEVGWWGRSSPGEVGISLGWNSADDEVVELIALAPAVARWGAWKGRIEELRPMKELVLEPMPQLQLRVVGVSGESLEVQGIVVRTWLDGTLAKFGYGDELAPSAAGVYSVGVPARPFELKIDLGPDFPSLSTRLDALPGKVLELSAASPYPLIRGRVEAAGVGIGGARISLHRGVRPGRGYIYNNFPIRFDGSRAASTTSAGEDGTFELPLAVKSPAVLVIQADGYAPREVDLGSDVAGAELGIELMPAGRVQGRVRMADGSDPIGQGYVLLRGALDTRTGKLGEGGVIDVDGLAPGGWYLRPSLLSIKEGDDDDYWQDGPGWSPAGGPDFIVRPGESSALDLIWPAREAGQMNGRLLVDGVPMSGWRITVSSVPGQSLDGVSSYQQTTTGTDGTYTIEVPNAPQVRWQATASAGSISLIRELDRDDLQGDLGEVNLPTALLGLDGVAPGQQVSYRVALSSGIECIGWTPPAGESIGAPVRVPAGELVFLRKSGAWGAHRPPLGPYQLEPGELLSVGWSDLQND